MADLDGVGELDLLTDEALGSEEVNLLSPILTGRYKTPHKGGTTPGHLNEGLGSPFRVRGGFGNMTLVLVRVHGDDTRRFGSTTMGARKYYTTRGGEATDLSPGYYIAHPHKTKRHMVFQEPFLLDKAADGVPDLESLETEGAKVDRLVALVKAANDASARGGSPEEAKQAIAKVKEVVMKTREPTFVEEISPNWATEDERTTKVNELVRALNSLLLKATSMDVTLGGEGDLDESLGDDLGGVLGSIASLQEEFTMLCGADEAWRFGNRVRDAMLEVETLTASAEDVMGRLAALETKEGEDVGEGSMNEIIAELKALKDQYAAVQRVYKLVLEKINQPPP